MGSKGKEIGLNFLRKSGIFRLAEIITRRQVRILAYHRFGKGYCTGELFEEQIGYLKRHFNIIGIDVLMDILGEKRELQPDSVIITVDDGYQDFYREAFPIIKKHDVPVTVFLTADFIDRGIWLWHDLLNYGIKFTPRAGFRMNGRVFELKKRDDRVELKICLDGICTSMTTKERDNFILEFLRELRVKVPEHPTSEYGPLTWSEIIEMSRLGVSFGSHTCTHPILSKISPQEALGEIQDSKKRIEEVLQRNVGYFSYPNGKENDFDEDIKKMVMDCGFACAMSMIYGMNDRDSDPYELRRIADRESFIHFVHDVSGFGVLRNSLHRIMK